MKLLLRYLLKMFSTPLNKLLKSKKVFVLYRNGQAIGDQLCMTALIRELYLQYGYRTVVFSNYSDIFLNNSHVLQNYSLKFMKPSVKKGVLFLLRNFRGEQIENFLFQPFEHYESYEQFMRESKTDMHLVQVHSRHFILSLSYDDLKNEIYFSDNELEKYQNKFKIDVKYAVIQPMGKVTYTPNKEWGFDNFQKVVDLYFPIQWMQVGLNEDRLLENVIDMRSKTDLRELFFIVSRAEFVLANEGLINHIASAFSVKSFVIFSGFSNVGLGMYSNVISISQVPRVECAPCWRTEECNIEGKPCLSTINAEKVAGMIEGENKNAI